VIVFQKEQLSDALIDELMPLGAAHKQEVSSWPEEELSPDWPTYFGMQDIGCLLIVTARDDGNLVGYSFCIIQNHLHYSKTKFAHQDLIYIDPSYRGSGKKLIQFSEDILRDMGVKHINQHVKEKPDFSPMLKRMGYRFCETIYTKRL